MFDRLDHVFQYGSVVLLPVDADEVRGVLGVDQLLKSSVLQQLLFDLGMLVVGSVQQSLQNLVIVYVFLEHVVEPVGHRVEPPLLQLVVDQVVTHLQRHEEAGLLIKLLQHRDLIVGRWGSLEDPTVSFAVRLAQSLLEKVHGDVVRDGLSILNESPELICRLVVALSSNQVLANLIHIQVYQLVFLRNLGGMLLRVDSGRTHKNDFGRLSWCVAVIELQDSNHFFKRGQFVFAALEFSNTTGELILDSLEVDSVLS